MHSYTLPPTHSLAHTHAHTLVCSFRGSRSDRRSRCKRWTCWPTRLMRKRPACQRELNPWSSLWSLSEPFAKPASVKCRGLSFIVHTHEEFKHEGMAVGARTFERGAKVHRHVPPEPCKAAVKSTTNHKHGRGVLLGLRASASANANASAKEMATTLFLFGSYAVACVY